MTPIYHTPNAAVFRCIDGSLRVIQQSKDSQDVLRAPDVRTAREMCDAWERWLAVAMR